MTWMVLQRLKMWCWHEDMPHNRHGMHHRTHHRTHHHGMHDQHTSPATDATYYGPPATDHTIYCHGTTPQDCETGSCLWTTYTNNKSHTKYKFWSKETNPPQSPCVKDPTQWTIVQQWIGRGLAGVAGGYGSSGG